MTLRDLNTMSIEELQDELNGESREEIIKELDFFTKHRFTPVVNNSYLDLDTYLKLNELLENEYQEEEEKQEIGKLIEEDDLINLQEGRGY